MCILVLVASMGIKEKKIVTRSVESKGRNRVYV